MRRVFKVVDFQQLVRRFSEYVDYDGPLGYHVPEQGGYIDVDTSTCMYIWILDGRCAYVGQVHRQGSRGLVNRMSRHHRPIERYEGVWLIPMQPHIPRNLLKTYERSVIRRYRPAHNLVGR